MNNQRTFLWFTFKNVNVPANATVNKAFIRLELPEGVTQEYEAKRLVRDGNDMTVFTTVAAGESVTSAKLFLWHNDQGENTR